LSSRLLCISRIGSLTLILNFTFVTLAITIVIPGLPPIAFYIFALNLNSLGLTSLMPPHGHSNLSKIVFLFQETQQEHPRQMFHMFLIPTVLAECQTMILGIYFTFCKNKNIPVSLSLKIKFY
jgi:hypothetical protein